MRGVHLDEANLRGAKMFLADLVGAGFNRTHLESADLGRADLRDANLRSTCLAGADLEGSHLEGAWLKFAHLEGASFRTAFVDGATLLWDCTIDSKTDFSGVGLASARVEPRLVCRLHGNIRRFHWQEWYEQHRLLKWPVRSFWSMSDYGQSTLRIIGWFLLLAIVFAALYASFPGLVANLHETGEPPAPVSCGELLMRSVYFSVVTMTTLGFGDMCASPGSIFGYVLLMLHVILGYILLGALVCRLAILFQEP